MKPDRHPLSKEDIEAARTKLRPGDKAFTAVVHDGKFVVGRAECGQSGYVPVLGLLGQYPDYEAATAKADELNRLLGLDDLTATLIVADSMRKRDELTGKRREVFGALWDALSEILENAGNGIEPADREAGLKAIDLARTAFPEVDVADKEEAR